MADTDQPAQQEQPAMGNGDQSVLEEAQHLLVQGKRFMALGDYQLATDSLEQAVQLYDAYYGVAKIQCADAYLEYGNALVALANMEAGSGADKIMKKAGIEDGEEEEEEDDDDEEDGDEEEASDGQSSETEDKKPTENGKDHKEQNGESNGKDVPMELGSQEKKTENNHQGGSSADDKAEASAGPSTSNHKEQEPTPGTSSGGDAGGSTNDEEVGEEEATTIEIAWEVLCLAKRLFMTDESLEGRMKLAETLQKLGEISIEWDNNDNAVSILEECLNIRKAILPPEDRLIALTYYHLGLAHSFKSDTENANANFQHAIDVIEKRIKTLSADLEKAKSAQDTQTVSACEKEINELKELLPDMTMRMDDSKEDQAQSDEVLKRQREELQQEDAEAKKVCLDKSKPVDDISHLVKRKAT